METMAVEGLRVEVDGEKFDIFPLTHKPPCPYSHATPKHVPINGSSPQQAAENLRSLEGTNHPSTARLPRSKLRGNGSLADSISNFSS